MFEKESRQNCWTAAGENGLIHNPKKCIHCIFSIRGNADTKPDFKATINANALSTVEFVIYLAVSFARDAKWTTHIEEMFSPFA